MNTKQRALYALMEEQAYSPGLIETTIALLAHSNEALDELILFVEDHRPSEKEVMEKTAELLTTPQHT